MLAKQITSLQHPIVKGLVKLRQNKEERTSSKTVLVMGKTMIQELAKHLPLRLLLITKETEAIKANETYLVTQPVLKKITGLENPDGMAAVVSLPKEQNLSKKNALIVLNGLTDPGNVGTIFRTALGLGWEGIFLTPGTVDPCNDKALRAAKGATFLLPYCYATEEEILQLKRQVIVADAKGLPLKKIHLNPPFLLVLGSESAGPAFTFAKNCTKVSIPMSPEIESYNVAIAGAILMYGIKNETR